jgi:hypothetical protein
MKNPIKFLLPALLLTSCVSTSVLFQDGESAGKGDSDVSFGISYNLSPTYEETDSVSRKVIFKPFRVPAPYGAIHGHYGLTDRLDFGGSFGIGLLCGGLGVSSKFALLPNTSRFNAALYTGANFSISFEELEDAFINFRQWMVGIPLSIDVSETQTLVIQPLYSRDYYKVKYFEDVKYKGAYYPRVYHLGFGCIKKNLIEQRELFFNLTMNYIPEQKKAYPTFGFALRK